MVLKAACTLLVVFTLAVVLTNQNDAEDSPIEVGGPATNRATSEPKSDPQDEVQRLRRSFGDIKAHVAIRLRECQGLPMGFSDTVVSAEEGESDQSYRLTPLPQMNRKRLPLRVSREEEEWMRLAGELHAENCVELLLNRVSVPYEDLQLSMIPWRQGDPAFYFLCQIGTPACKPTLSRIALESDVKIRRRLTLLLQRCTGNAAAKSWLKSFKDTCETEEKQNRVQLAIEQCEETPLPRGVVD